MRTFPRLFRVKSKGQEQLLNLANVGCAPLDQARMGMATRYVFGRPTLVHVDVSHPSTCILERARLTF